MTELFFTKDDLAFLHETTDPALRAQVDRALQMAEKAVGEPVYQESQARNTADGYASQHENYYQVCRPFDHDALLLIFADAYTGESRYFEHFKAQMLAYVGYERWHGRGWHGKAELVTASFCAGMALGYAAFRERLTDAERATIVEGTYRLGIRAAFDDWMLPGTKIHAIDTMGHNWWAVCVCTAAMAAIAMEKDLPDGRHLAEVAARGMEQWFRYPGNPINCKPATMDHGGFYESVSYFDFALSEYLRFAGLFLRLTGKRPFDDRQLLEETSAFFVNTYYPSTAADYYLPFGDTSGRGLLRSIPYLVGQVPELNQLRWYLLRCAPATEEHETAKLLYARNIFLLPAEQPTTCAACYEGIGWAVFRDRYAENGTMLAVKCGDTWNHAHADAASFVLYRNGVPEITDSLTCNYGDPRYLDYFCASKAHNVVLFNGKGQDPRDIRDHVRNRGRLYNFTDEPGFRYVAADASGPMGRYFRKHLRHFLWLDDFILIYDDIQAYEPGEVEFLLHGEKENCFRMLTPCRVTEEIGQGGDGFYGREPEEVPYWAYRQQTDENGRVKFVSVLCLKDGLTPEMRLLPDGLKVTCGETTVYINLLSDGRIMHHNCDQVLDGIDTDAVLAVVQKGRHGVVNGSILRHGGKSDLDTLARVTGWTEGKTPDWLK